MDLGNQQWLAVDVRLGDRPSGLGRFTRSLSLALARALEAEGSQVRLLLASPAVPAPWARDLASAYPKQVVLWGRVRWGSGAAPSLWSTWTFLELDRLCGGRALWLAPGNVDRPLSLTASRTAVRSRVLQVIHDTIPVEFPRSYPIAYRWQYRLMVRRTLRWFPHVLTVSQHTASSLGRLCPQRRDPISILPLGVEEGFGARPRPKSRSAEQIALRAEVLRALGREPDLELLQMPWLLGVGRGGAYKSWNLSREAAKQVPATVLSLRLGGAESSQGSSPELLEISRSTVSDQLLASAYAASSVLLHPSQGEGFGLPPLEAAYSGLPVIFREGTAVSQHFSRGVLPGKFWRGVDASGGPDQWAHAISEVLHDPEGELERLGAELAVRAPRRVISDLAGGDRTWRTTARTLMEYVRSASEREQ